MMTPRRLGTSDLLVSPVAFGAWAIGGWMWGGTEEQDSLYALHASIDQGITTIDTAAIYGMGYSEQLVGKAIKGRRDKVVIATKCGMRWDSDEGSNPWSTTDAEGRPITVRRNAKPDSIIYECEQSLKRLGVDVIDLYQLHWPDETTPVEESWRAMMTLKEQGKVRAIGLCNHDAALIGRAHALSSVASNQPPYSLMRRGIESEILPFCRDHNIGTLAYSPLERGLLTGKVTPSYTFPEGDHRRNSPIFSPENRLKAHRSLEAIRPLAQKYNVTLAQLVINWTINVPGITCALVGARNAQQASENAGALRFTLTPDEHALIASTFSELI